ncbi:ABC transporter substrate-binding protein [Litorisediminicola beolgyonensis]|uniref:ABC transporter substrate-binding protein n=1 Tax=Litorisediminicola beolgyonensis TaxID=1173614 RepID=A0ABW3ZHJ3_9RHOB
MRAILQAFLVPGLVCAATLASAAEKTVLMATWRGCEEACRGVIDHLAEAAPEISVVVRDAARDRTQLTGLMDEARQAEADLIVSWGTSVTLATAGTLAQRGDPAFNHDIPQVFMIVADPVGSGIVESLDHTGRDNVTGTYNRVPEQVNVETLRELLPGMDALGLLYNPNEPNSVLKRDELAELVPDYGIRLLDRAFVLSESGAPRAEDIGDQVRALKASGADAFYVGSSSFLRANAAILGAAARDADLPVLSPYEEMVRNGHALISVAARYYEVGRLAGQQVEAILVEGRAPSDLPVARMKDFALTVNLEVSRDIDLWPPIALLEFAEIIK